MRAAIVDPRPGSLGKQAKWLEVTLCLFVWCMAACNERIFDKSETLANSRSNSDYTLGKITHQPCYGNDLCACATCIQGSYEGAE